VTDPGLALQGAIVAALGADAAVSNLVGARLYDLAPDDVAFPFVALGEIQVVDDGTACFEDAAEIYVTVHVWSRAVGRPEAHRIAGAVRNALHLTDLDLGADLDLVEIRHRDTRVFTDADGRTAHGVMTFRAMVDPVT
jgi:hypothetical protein